jgi:hypothetical protein
MFRHIDYLHFIVGAKTTSLNNRSNDVHTFVEAFALAIARLDLLSSLHAVLIYRKH